MLHNELRELLVEAYKKHPVAKDIAEAFSVSKDTVYRLVRQKAQTGTVALRASQRGRKKVLTEKDLILAGAEWKNISEMFISMRARIIGIRQSVWRCLHLGTTSAFA